MGWLKAAQTEDTQRKQLEHFRGFKSTKTEQKRKPFIPYRKKKHIRNMDVDEEEDEDSEDEEEDYEDLDLCVAGTNEGACFNCQEIGHYSRNCPKPKKFQKKKVGRFTKAGNLAKDIRALDTETRDLLIDLIQEEGFQ